MQISNKVGHFASGKSSIHEFKSTSSEDQTDVMCMQAVCKNYVHFIKIQYCLKGLEMLGKKAHDDIEGIDQLTTANCATRSDATSKKG